MGLCEECNHREIQIQKRKLCLRCYMRGYMEDYRKKGMKKIPPETRKAYRLRNIKDTYGVEFFKDLKAVQKKHFHNLSTVAKKYNVSREYVRQIHNLIYGSGATPFLEAKRQERKESEATVCTNDPRHKVAEYPENSKVHTGAVAELLFFEKCKSYGLNIQTPCKQQTDIQVNGYVIDVKSSINAMKTNSGAKSSYHHFHIRPEQRKLCDFFACYLHNQDVFYIIPNKDKGFDYDKMRSIYIRVVPSNYCSAKNKYREYKNLFSQLFIPKPTITLNGEHKKRILIDFRQLFY